MLCVWYLFVCIPRLLHAMVSQHHVMVKNCSGMGEVMGVHCPQLQLHQHHW